MKSEIVPLSAEFYAVDVVTLARDLLGKVIVRNTKDGIIKAMIVETEAYKAPEDKACHAYNNKKTERTKWFWQDGGHIYMYSIYGDNWCMNITAADKDSPEAVLIRAVEPIEGIEIVKANRSINSKRL
jgi:DNA-3-methyladenine glycosylase